MVQKQIVRKCSVCKLEKFLSDFWKDSHSNDGIRKACRDCSRKNHLQWYQKNKNHKKSLELQRKYGITLEGKRELYEKQEGKCLICRRELVKSKDCHVDHNHKTGKIRGLVCSKCNLGISFVEDFVFLESALEYLGVRYEFP